MIDSSTGERFFVITGMHRSHTSLLGRMLVNGGLRFHSDLVGANQSNPYGHYEDVDFLALQKRILDRNGARWFRNIADEFEVLPEDIEAAKELISRRRDVLGNGWGFKNPQTTLFLDFWERWPEARFLFIFRDPQEVLSSLYRRMGSQIYYRPDAWVDMARAYSIYNQKLASFKRTHPDKTFLINSRDLLQQPSVVLGAAAEKLEMPINAGAIAPDLVDKSIKSAPSSWLATRLTNWAARKGAVVAAYEAVCALSDSGASGS